MDYDDFLELVKRRRSIRKFKPNPIPDEYVDKIIEVARWAPSGLNSQPWDFVIVRKQELKDRIAQIIKENFDVLLDEGHRGVDLTKLSPSDRMDLTTPINVSYRNAPVFIILFGDIRTKVALPIPVQSNEDLFLNVYISSLASAFLYMHLAATALGLASQWLTAVRLPPVQSVMKELLGIPGEMEAYDMMVVGYPDAEPRPKLLRSKEKMVHYDYCGKEDFRTDEEVNDFARRTKTWTLATIRREAVN